MGIVIKILFGDRGSSGGIVWLIDWFLFFRCFELGVFVMWWGVEILWDDFDVSEDE